MLAPLPGHLGSWQGPRPADQLRLNTRPCGRGWPHPLPAFPRRSWPGTVSELGRELSRTQTWGSSASDTPSKTRTGDHVGYTDWPTRHRLCLWRPFPSADQPCLPGPASGSPVISPRACLPGLQLEHTTLFCAPAGRKWTWVALSQSQGSGRAGSPQRLQEGICPLCFPNFVAHGLFLPPAPEPSIT